MGLGQYMLYDSSGNRIVQDENDTTGEQFFRDSVQAVWERMEAERTEMQELHDAVEEHRVAMVDAITAGNEILQ